MPPKEEKKGPTAKQLEASYSATAYHLAYRAACRGLKIKPYEPLLQLIENSIEGFKLVEKVVVRDELMGPEGVRAIVDALAGYPYCRNLCFWRCAIGDEGVAAICDLLSAGAEKWSIGTKLKLLEITNDGGERHIRASIESNDEQPGSPVVPVPCTATISHHGLKLLGGVTSVAGVQLKVLSLDHNHLGDAGITTLIRGGLFRCASLERLNLGYNSLTVEGAKVIAELFDPLVVVKLQDLNLQGNNLRGEGCAVIGRAIAESASIKVLNLASNDLDETLEPLEILRDSFMANNSLTHVDLNYNPIGTRGAMLFLPYVAAKESVVMFRLTERIGRVAAENINSIIAGRKKKPKKKAKKKDAK
eukprot:jgi/Mesvir1/17626/Mv08851-RA.1